MPDFTALPSADDLFHKWKQFLENGALTSAAEVAGEHSELISPLQQRINNYISDRAAGLEETLTVGADTPLTAEPPPNLKGFTVLETLGQGGMGKVYRVRDALDRVFALKLARRGQLSQAGRARFLDEAKAMAKLNHPHVARIHHYDLLDDEQPYFLMPVYPASLKDRLGEYQADPKKAVQLMIAVADGVGHLHSRGLVHRDLKPHNILIAEDGQPAVSDFGLVKDLADSTAGDPGLPGSQSAETKPTGAKRSRTVAGLVVGTRAYMAPEQAAGLTQLASPKWDVWAIGVILHELLTGKFPRSSDAPERLLDPKEPDNPPPSTLKPGLDPKLERIIRRCLARDEADRYADAREVAADLQSSSTRRDRGSRKWLLAVPGLIVVVGIAIGIMRTPKVKHEPEVPPVPQDPAAVVLARLAEHGGAELLDDHGLPIYSSIVLGAEMTSTRPWITDSAYTIDTQRKALVELVPAAARGKGIRLRAQLRMNDGNMSAGRVGLYGGHSRVATSDGPAHFIAEISFCEHVANRLPPARQPKDGGRRGEFALSGRLTGNQPESARPLDLSHIFLPTREFDSPRPPRGGDERFREIVLELTPTHVRAKCEEFDAIEAPVSLFAGTVGRLGPPTGVKINEPLSLDVDGGLGIMVYQASVSIRSVRVELLD